MNTPLRIDVPLGQHSYPLHIGPGLLKHTALWRSYLRGVHVLLVSDTNVAPLYAQRLYTGLDGLSWSELTLPAGEPSKTVAKVQQGSLAFFSGILGDDCGFVTTAAGDGLGEHLWVTFLQSMTVYGEPIHEVGCKYGPILHNFGQSGPVFTFG